MEATGSYGKAVGKLDGKLSGSYGKATGKLWGFTPQTPRRAYARLMGGHARLQTPCQLEANMIKIEKNIPMPGKTKVHRFPFREMEVGDSFQTEAPSNSVVTAAWYAGKDMGGAKFSVRKQDDGTVRCWRVS